MPSLATAHVLWSQGEEWPNLCSDAIGTVNRSLREYVGRQGVGESGAHDGRITLADFSYLFLNGVDPVSFLSPLSAIVGMAFHRLASAAVSGVEM
jgi:hypothetical protein